MFSSGLKTARGSSKSVCAHLPKLSAWHTRSDHDARAEIVSPFSPIACSAPRLLLGFICQKCVAVISNSSVKDEVRETAKETIKTLHLLQNTFPGLQKQGEMKAEWEAVQAPVGKGRRSSLLWDRVHVWGEKAPFWSTAWFF